MNVTKIRKTGEQAICPVADWEITEQDLLFDLKCLMKEYYIATFKESGESLKLSFENGQTFDIFVKSCN